MLYTLTPREQNNPKGATQEEVNAVLQPILDDMITAGIPENVRDNVAPDIHWWERSKDGDIQNGYWVFQPKSKVNKFTAAEFLTQEVINPQAVITAGDGNIDFPLVTGTYTNKEGQVLPHFPIWRINQRPNGDPEDPFFKTMMHVVNAHKDKLTGAFGQWVTTFSPLNETQHAVPSLGKALEKIFQHLGLQGG